MKRWITGLILLFLVIHYQPANIGYAQSLNVENARDYQDIVDHHSAPKKLPKSKTKYLWIAGGVLFAIATALVIGLSNNPSGSDHPSADDDTGGFSGDW